MNYIVDLRAESDKLKTWTRIDPSSDSDCLVYIPELPANGFYTLQPGTSAVYQLTPYHHTAYVCGSRIDDPALELKVPAQIVNLSEKGGHYPVLYLLPS